MKYLFPKIAKSETLNVIGPAFVDVFQSDVSKIQPHVKPILSVDLNQVDSSWHGKAHFIYASFYSQSKTHFEFKLVGKDAHQKYAFSKAYETRRDPKKNPPNNGYIFEDSIETDPTKVFLPDPELDPELGIKTVSAIQLDLSGHLEFIAFDLPEIEGDWWKWSLEQEKKLLESHRDVVLLTEFERQTGQSHRRLVECMLCGTPTWKQYPDVPLNPDGEQMKFVGQLNSSLFSEQMHDFFLYLFYCPKHELVTQVVQYS